MRWTDRVDRRVKLRDLHILIALAESGSMSRAAKQLAVSQPVVSKAIADLEYTLGVRLLDRTSRGVEPTVYGRALLNCGIAVFDELRRGMQEVAFLSDSTMGELRVGGAGPFVDGLIPAVISRLAERHRRIEFNVTESDPPTLCRMLRERRLDLAICRTSSLMYSEDLEADSLFDEPLFVVAGLDNRWSRRRKIDLLELLDEPWTMPEQDNVAMALITDGFHSAGVTPPTPQVVSDSMATRTRLVEMGPFLTFLPGSALHFGAGRLRVKILPVALSMKAPPTQVITLKNRTPNAIARLFIDELHSIARPLKKGPRERRDASHPIKQANPAAPAKVTERRNNFAQGTTRT
jgi:DNA-binding transcriptional LysR family regulator